MRPYRNTYSVMDMKTGTESKVKLKMYLVTNAPPNSFTLIKIENSDSNFCSGLVQTLYLYITLFYFYIIWIKNANIFVYMRFTQLYESYIIQ